MKIKTSKFTKLLGLAMILSICIGFSHADNEIDLSDVKDIQNSVELSDDDNALINNAIKKVATLQTDIETITAELFALDQIEKEKNPELTTSYRQARSEIVRVISSITSASSKISASLKKLMLYQQQMHGLVQELAEAKSASEIAKDYLAEYMKLLYKTQLKIYSEDGDKIDDIRLFINSDNYNETFIGNDLLSAMTAQLYNLIEKSEQEEQNKTALLSKLGKLKIAAQENIQTYRNEIESLEQKKQYLLSFIQLYKAESASSSKFEVIFKNKEDVNKMINSFINDIIKKNYRQNDNIPAKIKELMKSKDSSEDYSSPLARPIYPIKNILRYFNDAQFEKENGFKHQGIQIQAVQGTPVYASRDGVVYYVSNTIDSISRIMIVHQEGYVTVYEYMNQIIVKAGDVVQRGQLIGYSGGEPGTLGAGFASEGENLTYSIYKDGVAVDPLTLLDLSVVTDWENTLPKDYRIKYLNDQLVRPINVSDIKPISGNTVDERAQNFLNGYGVGVYKDLNFWKSVVEGTNIDRDVVICIACAESTLGNYLTTNNNIGNVGNDDSGNRVGYSTPYAGARVIPLTLNNKYLGNYHTINQLSRYGNSDGKIYASSPINWQTNVQRCLSKIKGYYIPEDFPFRVGINPEN